MDTFSDLKIVFPNKIKGNINFKLKYCTDIDSDEKEILLDFQTDNNQNFKIKNFNRNNQMPFTIMGTFFNNRNRYAK